MAAGVTPIPEQALVGHGRSQDKEVNQLRCKLTRMKKKRDVFRERRREGLSDPTMPQSVPQPIDMSVFAPVVQRASQLSAMGVEYAGSRERLVSDQSPAIYPAPDDVSDSPQFREELRDAGWPV